jgi:hypothetical protein
MAPPIVSDELWQLIEPLLPPELPTPKGGRPRIPDRQCLAGHRWDPVRYVRAVFGWELGQLRAARRAAVRAPTSRREEAP